MYEVSPNSTVLCNGVKYPGGALLPSNIPDIESLVEAGAVREIPKAKVARPKPVKVSRSFSHPGYSSDDPSTISNVPLRLMPSLLSSISDKAVLDAMHEADSRKGGKDLIEERKEELEA